MNIIQENIDEVTALLKVKVTESDYLQKVENELKTYQKKAVVPGFRPGKVPTGILKKKYFMPLKVEEINKLLTDSVSSYLSENKLDVLGSPMPKRNEEIDWENQKEFEFIYEMGLSPKFTVELSGKDKFTYATVKVDEDLITKYSSDIAKRYGKVEEAEVSAEGDLLNGDFVEMDGNGTIVPGGIFKNGSLFLDRIKDEATKKALLGVKKDDKIILSSQHISENKTDLAALLGIDKEKAETLDCKLQFTVKGISRLGAAEINQDFFDKLYGAGAVTSEEEFRLKIKGELNSMFANDSDRKFYNEVVDHLMKKININLPNEFLKRWILATNDKPITAEQLEAEYENYSQAMKWQLIENKIIKDYGIKVTHEEIVDDVKAMIISQYSQMGFQPTDEQMDDTVKSVLKNEEEAKKIFERLYGQKVMELFKTTFTLENKELAYDDFFKSAK